MCDWAVAKVSDEFVRFHWNSFEVVKILKGSIGLVDSRKKKA